MGPEPTVAPSERATAPPRRLGRYELIRLLAKGGMGEVHLARTRGLGGFERLVVIKCALPALAERTQSMLLAEARLAATLQHTNIVQVHDVDTDGQIVFLAMEYLHGQDLRAISQRSWGAKQALPLDQALAIVIAVCAGLHYAHDKRDNDGSLLEIVHRDVSPSNVFVTYDGGVKLIDFGIAKATTLPSETQLGTLKGKPGYMSPEQCRCEPLDRRSDVFCLGILLYELTTGRKAFRADNEYQLTKQIIEHQPAAPSTLEPDFPRALEAIIMRALAKDRRDRQPTALALQDELGELCRARRLDLSQLALGRMMANLFADEIAAWQAAQRAGQSLVDHVIKRTTTTAAIVPESPIGTVETAVPTTTAPRPQRASRSWMVVVAGAVVAVAAAIIIYIRGGTTAPAPAPPAPSIGHETSPIVQPPAETMLVQPRDPAPPKPSGADATPANPVAKPRADSMRVANTAKSQTGASAKSHVATPTDAPRSHATDTAKSHATEPPPAPPADAAPRPAVTPPPASPDEPI